MCVLGWYVWVRMVFTVVVKKSSDLRSVLCPYEESGPTVEYLLRYFQNVALFFCAQSFQRWRLYRSAKQ